MKFLPKFFGREVDAYKDPFAHFKIWYFQESSWLTEL